MTQSPDRYGRKPEDPATLAAWQWIDSLSVIEALQVFGFGSDYCATIDEAARILAAHDWQHDTGVAGAVKILQAHPPPDRGGTIIEDG